MKVARESSRRLSTSPFGSLLLAAALFLINDVHCSFINKGIKKIKGKLRQQNASSEWWRVAAGEAIDECNNSGPMSQEGEEWKY